MFKNCDEEFHFERYHTLGNEFLNISNKFNKSSGCSALSITWIVSSEIIPLETETESESESESESVRVRVRVRVPLRLAVYRQSVPTRRQAPKG
jgi:hypothetical protein